VPRRSNRPEQLHLQLQWQYLNWLSETGEEHEFYEKASLALLGEGKSAVQKGPLWPETKQVFN
jgi:hypothetical protein